MKTNEYYRVPTDKENQLNRLNYKKIIMYRYKPKKEFNL